MSHKSHNPISSRYFLLTIIVLLILITASFATEPKYITFTQSSLSEMKVPMGIKYHKERGFMFINNSADTVYGIHVNLNKPGCGEFRGFHLDYGGCSDQTVIGRGAPIAPGDTVYLIVGQRRHSLKVTDWYWTDYSLIQVGPTYPGIDQQHDYLISYRINPSGGNVREYIYKRIINRPEGLVIGIPQANRDSAKVYGWIRYLKADRKYFPHNGSARCFDLISTGSSTTRKFIKELLNPHVRKHNNRLLGELHALKLAIIANDSGLTEPLDTTALGDLIFDHPFHPEYSFNGLTLRQLAAFTDTALTYCNRFAATPEIYSQLDAAISAVNSAYGDGNYWAISFSPLLIAAGHYLGEAGFIHPNPTAAPFARRTPDRSILDQQPGQFSLLQNFPNPFNPTTTISFTLNEPSLVSLKVYNLLGQEVKTLLENEAMDDGEQSIEFNANDLTTGVYFYKLAAQGIGESGKQFQAIKRMVLIK